MGGKTRSVLKLTWKESGSIVSMECEDKDK